MEPRRGVRFRIAAGALLSGVILTLFAFNALEDGRTKMAWAIAIGAVLCIAGGVSALLAAVRRN